MKNSDEDYKKMVPSFRIDPSLDKYDHVILFPEMPEMANEVIRESGPAWLTDAVPQEERCVKKDEKE